jgi:hypothetical protein
MRYDDSSRSTIERAENGRRVAIGNPDKHCTIDRACGEHAKVNRGAVERGMFAIEDQEIQRPGPEHLDDRRMWCLDETADQRLARGQARLEAGVRAHASPSRFKRSK